MKRVSEKERLWYKATSPRPRVEGRNVLLHFARLTGKRLSTSWAGVGNTAAAMMAHFDITGLLKIPATGGCGGCVRSDGRRHAASRKANPNRMDLYTPTSGIWQPSGLSRCQNARGIDQTAPDIDAGSITVDVRARSRGEVAVRAEVLDEGRSLTAAVIQVSSDIGPG